MPVLVFQAYAVKSQWPKATQYRRGVLGSRSADGTRVTQLSTTDDKRSPPAADLPSRSTMTALRPARPAMKAIVKKDGVLIPKRLLKGAKQVEIVPEPGRIIILPIPAADDPVFELGSNPGHSGATDLSARHDEYLYDRDT